MAYPSIEPYETGMLDTGDGNSIYWEACGNPEGMPVLVVHGGPGSGCSTGMRRSWKPAAPPHHPVRPAQLRPEYAPRERPRVVVIEDSGHTGSQAMQDALHAARDRLFATISERTANG